LIATDSHGDTSLVDHQDSPPALTVELDHFGVSVTDLRRSLDFYCHVLGAVVVLPPHAVDEFNFRRAVVFLNGSTGIDLNEHAANSGETFDPARTGLDHLGFSVSSHEELVAWAAHLDANGVTRSPLRNVDGVGEAIDFRDPDGMQLELWHHDHSGKWTTYVQQKIAEFGNLG